MARDTEVYCSGGEWWVVVGDKELGPYQTNAEAWRAVDRYYGEPVSRQEAVAAYHWRKQAMDE